MHQGTLNQRDESPLDAHFLGDMLKAVSPKESNLLVEEWNSVEVEGGGILVIAVL
jgi:hypothetical protein